MPERVDADLYVANLRALLPALRHLFATLVADSSSPGQARALADLGRLARTVTDLSAAFHVEDGALVAAALVDACSPSGGAVAMDEWRLGALGDALAYLETRLNAIERLGRVAALDMDERMAAVRLLARVSQPHPAVGAAPASAPLAERTENLSADDAAIVQAFQAKPLRRTAPPVGTATAAQPPAKGGIGAEGTRAPDTSTTTTDMADSADDVESIPGALRGLILGEVGEDLLELRQTLLAFEQDPAAEQRLEAAAHLAHKIKGEAGMLEGANLDALVHQLEEQLGAVRGHSVAADARAAALLVRSFEEVERVHTALAAGQAPPLVMPRLKALTHLLREGAAPVPAILPGLRAEPAETSALATDEWERSGERSGPLLRVDLRRMDDLSRRIGALAANRTEMARARASMARMQTELDRALGRLGELSTRFSDLRPLVAASSDIVPATASLPYQVARLLANTPGFETLPPAPATPAEDANAPAPHVPEVERYTEYDQVAIALSEAIGDVETCGHGLRSVLTTLDSLAQEQEGQAAAIQQAIMQVRLIPLRDHILPLRHTVRKLAHEHGKSVTLHVQGEMTEIDREVSDGLGEALMQLVRNAVFHGIEAPEARTERGKPAEGSISIYAYSTGSEVTIQVSDDGRGINPDAVIAAARLRGLVDADTAQALRPADALNLIFEHGFSTLPHATAAAGHGIGMAEVAARLASLHGTIQVRSTPGQGTAFHLRVPISFSNVRVLEVRMAGQSYIVPAAFVRQVVPLDAPVMGDRLRVTLDGAGEHEEPVELDVPIMPLAGLLGRPSLATQSAVALVVDLGRQRAALLVEGVAAEREVVVRSLPPHLRRRATRAATLTPDGAVLLLLDLPELIARARAGDHLPLAAPPDATSEGARDHTRPAVLVVDDSITMRRTLEDMLSHAGYAVATAHDGMDALEQILRAPPHVILLDIEMPRLDGYELLTLLRARKDLADMRVAMLTSKATDRHRRHAEVLGADAFLVKPVTDEELLATVARLLALPG